MDITARLKNYSKNTFKKIRGLLLPICTFCVVLFLGVSILVIEASAKSFKIPQIQVEVEIQPNGNVLITEHRTYQFDGSFSWADYRLPLNGFADIKNITVSEGNQSFVNRNTEQPGTYLVQQGESSIRVKWFYEAENEKRTFSISYMLEGALVMGPEWGEFFWNYLSSDREKDTDLFNVHLSLPRPLRSDFLYLWSRGPNRTITLTKTEDGYKAEAVNVDDDESVRIRSVFPRTLFDQQHIATTDNSFSLEWAQTDEEAYRDRLAEQKLEEAKYAEVGRILNILVTVLSLGVFIYLYRRYGGKYSVEKPSARQIYEVPTKYHPVVAAWLLNKKTVANNMLLGNVMELARQGYFIIKEKQEKGSFLSSEKKVYHLEKTAQQPEGDLTEWDEYLLSNLNRELQDGSKELKELFTDEVYKEWKELIDEYGDRQNWFDTNSYTGATVNGILQVLLLALGVTAAFWSGPIALIGMGTAFCMAIASLAIIRRTKEGEQVYQQINGYKEQLKGKRSSTEDIDIDTNMLDRHVIFAVTLGMSQDKIESIVDNVGTNEVYFHWFILHGGSGSGSASTPADLASSLGTLSSSGAAAFPGTTGGAGGGAVAGAAGGGASGGAG